MPKLSSVAYHVHEVVFTWWEVQRENHYLKLAKVLLCMFVMPSYKSVLLDLSTLGLPVGFSEVLNIRNTFNEAPYSFRFLSSVGFNTLPIVAYASLKNHVDGRRFK